MNKLSKIFLFIIILLVIALVFFLYRLNVYKEAFLQSGEISIEINEKLSKMEQYDNRQMEKVTIEVVANSVTSSGATFITKDNNDMPFYWTGYYIIERKIGDSWKMVDKKVDSSFNYANEEILRLDENHSVEEKIDWSKTYGSLPAGIYKIQKVGYGPQSLVYIDSNEFEIK